MARLLKWTGYSALALLGMALLALGSLVFVMNTETGTRWAIDRVVAAVPGQLELGESSGTLWRGMHFARIVYRDANREIDAGEPDFSVSWATLLNRRLTLRHFTADTVRYRSLNTADAAEPLQLNVTPPRVNFSVTSGRLGEFVMSGRGEPVEVDEVAVDRFRTDGTIMRATRLTGTIRGVSVSASSIQMRLAGSVPLTAGVAWQLIDGEWSGKGDVEGTLVEIGFDQVVDGPFPANIDGTLTLPEDAGPRIDARVRWSRWIIDNAELTTGDARLQGWLDDYVVHLDTATITTAGQQAIATGAAAGDLEHLEQFTARLEGPVGIADTVGSLRWTPTFNAAGTVRATGTAGGLEWRGTGRLEVSPESLRCLECAVSVGDNRVLFNGDIVAGNATLMLQIVAPDPQQITPGLSGALRGRGSLSGAISDPLLALTISGKQLHLGPEAAPAFDLDLETTVRRVDTGILGHITSATVTEPATGQWQLDTPLDVRVSPGDIQLDEHAWSGGLGVLHVSGFEWSGSTTRIAADIDRLPLDFASAWLPEDLHLQGLARAEVNVTANNGIWSGSASWHQADTILRATHSGGEIADVLIPRIDMSLRLTDGKLVARADLAVEPGVTGQLDLEVDDLRPDAPMRGELRFSGEDWGWVSALVPEVDRIDGAISADVGARGPLNVPEFSGEVAWHNGALLIPALNVRLDDIDVIINGASAGTATIKGTAKAGDGRIAVDGSLRDVMQNQRSLDFRFTGNNAELVNWPEYRIWATPDLGLVGDAAGWRFNGRLSLPRADIRLRELPAGAIEVSPDAVILGAPAEESRPTRMVGDATLVLGDRVRVNALGLDTGLTGELQLRVRENRDPEAVGRVKLVDGVFEAHGQQLKIRQGELTFTGPLDDPLVDVRAVRVIETINGPVTAGIHLTGRATNLTSTVFSEPAMPDSDALSYLVVGRPLNQATEAEGADISGAAVALGIKQATRIVEQIGQSLGLDQLSLTGDGGSTTALVAGKQINRRLYARYAYGIFTRLGTMLIRYRMSERLTLEAGAGEIQSIDVLYSIETD